MGLWPLAIGLVALGGGLLLAGRLVPPEGPRAKHGGGEGDMANDKGKAPSPKPAQQAAFATPSMLAAAAASVTPPAPPAAPTPSASAAPPPRPASSGERPSTREGSKKERVNALVDKVKAEFDKILRESQAERRGADE